MIKPLIYNTAILLLLLSPLSLSFHIPSSSKNLKTQSQSSDLRSATSDLPTPVHDEVQKANSFLTDDAMERAEAGSKEEKIKLSKDVTQTWTDIHAYAAAIREGKTSWEDISQDDMDYRLKWVGLLHRRKRTPGKFMMRLKVPNGIVTSSQMRFYSKSVSEFDEEIGVVDITTRQNIQLRGVTVEAASRIIEGLHELNQTSFHSALDNVRNVVGSPLAGISDTEVIDTRKLCTEVNDLIIRDASGAFGNPRFANLPRKFNIAISGGDDDFSHCNINDLGFHAVIAEDGSKGFNLDVGGYMSIKRVAESVPLNLWIPENSVVKLCDAVLTVFRDEGERKNRQKSRLMWLVEQYGVEDFTARILKEAGEGGFRERQPHVLRKDYVRQELLGVHPQNSTHSRVGLHIPTGRLTRYSCAALADLADKYSDGEIRLTVDQNVIIPNVDNDDLKQLEIEVDAIENVDFTAGLIEGNVVSCTGAQFCGLALVETKANARRVSKRLEELVEVPKAVRMHWTGCPNSCGQAQCGDIGLMGAPARKEIDGKKVAVPGVNIFVGGKIGESPFLALEPRIKGIPLDGEEIVTVLAELLVSDFGGVMR
ncbi:hypothetical protein TL16_g01466, partial [Triparma laevis f. inornata]|uniref:Ferredoxin--nitrite reductase, chloroplastic n=2 Tax=Triparma laevis TaxID=1534972 RepID=A0A9W7CFZ0_9STRA